MNLYKEFLQPPAKTEVCRLHLCLHALQLTSTWWLIEKKLKYLHGNVVNNVTVTQRSTETRKSERRNIANRKKKVNFVSKIETVSSNSEKLLTTFLACCVNWLNMKPISATSSFWKDNKHDLRISSRHYFNKKWNIESFTTNSYLAKKQNLQWKLLLWLPSQTWSTPLVNISQVAHLLYQIPQTNHVSSNLPQVHSSLGFLIEMSRQLELVQLPPCMHQGLPLLCVSTQESNCM